MKNFRRTIAITVGSFALLLSSYVMVAGQYVPPPPSIYNSGTYDATRQIMTNRAVWRAALKKRQAAQSSTTSGTTSGGPFNNNKSSSGSTTFRSVASSIMPQKISAQMEKNDPNKRQHNLELMQMFLDQYTKTIQKGNAPRNDLAHAFTFLISTSYAVMTGNKVEKEQFQSAYQQVQAVLLQSPKLPSIPDREKQELYEGLVIMGSFPVYFTAMANDPSARDEAKIKQMKKLAKEMAEDNLEKIFGSSYKNIRFTEYGIDF